jgi:dTDP-4-amino-4,6-dideoxygalactose transaminase
VRVLISGKLAQGMRVGIFESEFSKLVMGRECVAVNSGTSGLHVALLALGLGPGDEVIVPSFTFAATANSVSLTGATPVFADIDPDTFNISVKSIEELITPRTKAIQVVHLYGLPADMSAVVDIAKRHKLLIIEDAAQAHLASINGQPVGTFGDAAVFSFYPTKNMTSGEGGMVILKDSEIARTVRLLRNQGMEKRYENEIVGMNLRMTEVHAAIGVEQLKKVSKWTAKRTKNANFLSRELKTVVCPKTPSGYTHVYHQYTIKVNGNRDAFIEYLKNHGIESGVYYPKPVHRLPAFNIEVTLPNTDRACSQVISLPIHPKLKKKDLRRMVRVLNGYSTE